MIKNNKVCKFSGCNNPPFSGGFCTHHIKKTRIHSKKEKEKNLSRGTSKGINIEQLEKDIKKIFASKARVELDAEFYKQIWSSRIHVCQCCGQKLYEVSNANFDHLLEKGKYPDLRYEAENIALICLECHDMKTRGLPRENHKKLINIAKVRFKEYLKYHDKI